MIGLRWAFVIFCCVVCSCFLSPTVLVRSQLRVRRCVMTVTIDFVLASQSVRA